MIWRCACGRPNIEQHANCVKCGKPRSPAEHSVEGADAGSEGPSGVVESPETPVSTPLERLQQRRPPAPGFVGRTLRRILTHYRRVLTPFVPGLVLLVVPIQIGYLEVSRALAEGRVANGTTMVITVFLTVLVTMASYYLIILTAFSVRDEELALAPFYTRPSWATIGILWLATVLYGLAIFFGFLLIVVPGLAALTLFSLVQPLVVLDKTTVGEALRASPRLVIGHGGPQALQVLAIILLAELGLTVLSFILLMPLSALSELIAWPHLVMAGELVIGGLLFPVHAVALTVLYDELVGIPRPEASA